MLWSRKTPKGMGLKKEQMTQVHVADTCHHQINKIAKLDQDNITDTYSSCQIFWIFLLGFPIYFQLALKCSDAMQVIYSGWANSCCIVQLVYLFSMDDRAMFYEFVLSIL